jgi:hypothetical protein
MTRVAAVDLGTNSTRLLVADVDGGQLEEVARRLTITRLGEGVDERRRLLPVPIARVRNCLADYRRELEALGAERTLAIATSAVRDAENGEAFLGEIEWGYGFTTRLLAGEEESALMVRGVAAGRPSTTCSSSSAAVTELGPQWAARSNRDEPRRRVRATESDSSDRSAVATRARRGGAYVRRCTAARSRECDRCAGTVTTSRHSIWATPNATQCALMAIASLSGRSRSSSSGSRR